LYWAQSPQGFAFAGGVRGVLMAPGVSAAPDVEAIREAVSFGGFRLGDRTNVAAVKMVAGASVVTVKDGSPTFRRYWHWRDIAPVAERTMPELIEELHHRWQLAVKRRLAGARRPGQTLSGGLDSRAILAEAVPQTDTWTAITYGIAGCDDAKYARKAAEVVGATWLFHPLYGADWLDRRTQTFQQNDGLIDLTDSMHLETLPMQAERIDVHLSGYIGDAVSGPTFNEVTSVEGVLHKLPYYGTELGLGYAEAQALAEKMIEQLNGASARFALFDHKLPQATNRWCAAWRPWFRVRRPFTDYAFFDFCQGLPAVVRGVACKISALFCHDSESKNRRSDFDSELVVASGTRKAIGVEKNSARAGATGIARSPARQELHCRRNLLANASSASPHRRRDLKPRFH
jgi:hypothetical protein